MSILTTQPPSHLSEDFSLQACNQSRTRLPLLFVLSTTLLWITGQDITYLFICITLCSDTRVTGVYHSELTLATTKNKLLKITIMCKPTLKLKEMCRQKHVGVTVMEQCVRWREKGEIVSAWDCKNVSARAADMVEICMTLEEDVAIVSHPSPRGHRLVQSCKGRTTQKLSICTLPRSKTFPSRVSTVTLISSACTRPVTEVSCGGSHTYILLFNSGRKQP